MPYDMDQVSESIFPKLKIYIEDLIEAGSAQIELRLASKLASSGNTVLFATQVAERIEEVEKRFDEVERLQRDDPSDELLAYAKRYGVEIPR